MQRMWKVWLFALVGLMWLSACGSPGGGYSIKLQSATVDLSKATHGTLVLYDDPASVCSRITFENYDDMRGMLNNKTPFQFRFENNDAVFLDNLPEGKKLTAFLIVYSYDSASDKKEPMAIACQEKVKLVKGELLELTFKLNPVPED